MRHSNRLGKYVNAAGSVWNIRIWRYLWDMDGCECHEEWRSGGGARKLRHLRGGPRTCRSSSAALAAVAAVAAFLFCFSSCLFSFFEVFASWLIEQLPPPLPTFLYILIFSHTPARTPKINIIWAGDASEVLACACVSQCVCVCMEMLKASASNNRHDSLEKIHVNNRITSKTDWQSIHFTCKLILSTKNLLNYAN